LAAAKLAAIPLRKEKFPGSNRPVTPDALSVFTFARITAHLLALAPIALRGWLERVNPNSPSTLSTDFFLNKSTFAGAALYLVPSNPSTKNQHKSGTNFPAIKLNNSLLS
jgi:hypothetical protein